MHNDWFDVLAERGLLGAVIMAGVYLLPIAWFVGYARRSATIHTPPGSSEAQPSRLERIGIATAGITFPVSFLAAGVSQVNFTHNSGAMLYAFMTAALVSISVSVTANQR